MDQIPPAFWVVCLAFGVPGLLALLARWLAPTKPEDKAPVVPPPLPAVPMEVILQELDVEERAREERKRIEKELNEDRARTDKERAAEHEKATTPEEVAELMKRTGGKM